MRQRSILSAGYLVSVVFLLGLIGCGGHDEPVPIAFVVACTTVTCLNVDETSSFIADDGTEFITCVWLCAAFQGQNDRFVQLTFARPANACFVLSSTFVSDGIC